MILARLILNSFICFISFFFNLTVLAHENYSDNVYCVVLKAKHVLMLLCVPVRMGRSSFESKTCVNSCLIY